MRKHLGLVAYTIAPAGAATLTPAQADERSCGSQRAYSHVLTTDNGHSEIGESPDWRQARVADQLDLHGTRVRDERKHSGDVATVWFRKCSAWGPESWYVGILYNNWWADGYARVWQRFPKRPLRCDTEGSVAHY